MKLARFEALLSSYGARLQRWPEAERAAAHVLLETSTRAQQLLEAAAVLDDALDRARIAHESQMDSHEHEAMLTRLRHHVSAEIASGTTPGRAAMSGRLGWLRAWPISQAAIVHRRGLGLAMSGVLAITAGTLIGWMQAPKPRPVDMITLLESAPIGILRH
jgi:hypothetical protein